MEVSLQHWYVTGLQQQGVVPSLITSVGDAASSLLSIQFELNPEASSADQLLRVHSQPVEIIYDAVSLSTAPYCPANCFIESIIIMTSVACTTNPICGEWIC